MHTRYALIAACLLGCFFAAPTRAQEDSPSVDPDREVIVMFQPGTVIRPPDLVTGTPDAFIIPNVELLTLLLGAEVELMAQVMPGFEPEDRFATDLFGEPVELTDWSHAYLFRLPNTQGRAALLDELQGRTDVVYAEPNGRVESDDLPLNPAVQLNTLLGLGQGPLASTVNSSMLLPNDQFFSRQWALKNDGTSIQGSGTPDADIDANEAWDITTGDSWVKIAILDDGMQTGHPDFTGRVTGDNGDNSSHGTRVAGVAAAQGNNNGGIAGVAWNVGIINEDYGGGDNTTVANAVRSAYNRGAHVINNSWSLSDPPGRYSLTIRLAFADAYRVGSATVASMGNDAPSGIETQYPAAFGQGMISVGATTNTDVRASYSSRGPHIDVAAPGGADGCLETPGVDHIYTTLPNSGYGYTCGTSFSAPTVSGVAALLLSERSDLRPDDIEAILRFSAEDVNAAQHPGFDNELGAGRINARRALDLVRFPNVIKRYTSTGGTVHSSTGTYTWSIVSPTLSGTYIAKRYEVRRSFPVAHSGTWYAWGAGNGSGSNAGWSTENPNAGLRYTDIVSQTSNSVTLRTYVYEIWSVSGSYLGWYPAQPAQALFYHVTLGPPTPLSVSINGPSTVQGGQTYTWTADVSDGYPPYSSYKWEYFYTCSGCGGSQPTCRGSSEVPATGTLSPSDAQRLLSDSGGILSLGPTAPTCNAWVQAGTSSSLSNFTVNNHSATTGLELRLTVRDSNNTTKTATRTLFYSHGRPSGPEAQAGASLPEVYALDGAAPNPFRDEADVSFALPEAAKIRLVVYDLLGREVARLAEGPREAGWHTTRLNGRNLPSGVYVVRLTADGSAGSFVGSSRITLLR